MYILWMIYQQLVLIEFDRLEKCIKLARNYE